MMTYNNPFGGRPGGGFGMSRGGFARPFAGLGGFAGLGQQTNFGGGFGMRAPRMPGMGMGMGVGAPAGGFQQQQRVGADPMLGPPQMAMGGVGAPAGGLQQNQMAGPALTSRSTVGADPMLGPPQMAGAGGMGVGAQPPAQANGGMAIGIPQTAPGGVAAAAPTSKPIMKALLGGWR